MRLNYVSYKAVAVNEFNRTILAGCISSRYKNRIGKNNAVGDAGRAAFLVRTFFGVYTVGL